MLRDATRFKLDVLDQVFRSGEIFPVPKTDWIGAGEMLAMVQLLGSGEIKIRAGEDIPNSRYGVDWQRVGYETRKLGKSSFWYGVVLSPTETYAYGREKVVDIPIPIPTGDPARADMTPVWTSPLSTHLIVTDLDALNTPDENSIVVRETWETILASVLGIISLRPGVHAEEISKSLGEAVGPWEVELMLEWAGKSGFVETNGFKLGSGMRSKPGQTEMVRSRGWRTKESWWLCLA
jgi:hypothetical protein